MAEEENNEGTKSASGGKGMIIVLIALVVILLLAVGGGAYFLYSQGMFSPKNADSGEEMVKKEEAGDSKETFKANIDDLVLNITNAKGKEKLMKLSFAVKSVEPTIAVIIEEYRAEVIDVVINQISARSSEELLTVGGKDVNLSEFTAIYNKNNSKEKSTKESVQEYLDLYVKFKLKVKEAEDLGFDTVPKFIAELKYLQIHKIYCELLYIVII